MTMTTEQIATIKKYRRLVEFNAKRGQYNVRYLAKTTPTPHVVYQFNDKEGRLHTDPVCDVTSADSDKGALALIIADSLNKALGMESHPTHTIEEKAAFASLKPADVKEILEGVAKELENPSSPILSAKEIADRDWVLACEQREAQLKELAELEKGGPVT